MSEYSTYGPVRVGLVPRERSGTISLFILLPRWALDLETRLLYLKLYLYVYTDGGGERCGEE